MGLYTKFCGSRQYRTIRFERGKLYDHRRKGGDQGVLFLPRGKGAGSDEDHLGEGGRILHVQHVLAEAVVTSYEVTPLFRLAVIPTRERQFVLLCNMGLTVPKRPP